MTFDQAQPEPGKWLAVTLTALMHALLLLFLIYGIQWQTKAPQAVEVELYRAAPSVVQPMPESRPAPAPPKEAQPASQPEPSIPKPDIALKEKVKPKPVPAVTPPPKPVPDKTRELEQRKQMQDALKRENEQLAQNQAAQEARDLRDKQAAVARDKAIASYTDKIKAKIRPHIVPPLDAKGNPEAIFIVVQLPSGEVLSVKLKKSSGAPALDATIERAILKSSPLPKPGNPELFRRELELKFRPLEE